MPRSGYSREDRAATRSGYVAHNHDPVNHRGGPESRSGRINHARMNERASPDTFPASRDSRSRGLHVPRSRLYSSAAEDLSETPPRDDLYRSEPSQEFERRTRGYNPGFYGERVPSFGSSPQLSGLDHGYGDEGHWPRDTPINRDHDDYKRDEYRGNVKATMYSIDEEQWNDSRSSTNYRTPHMRDEDGHDQRQSLLAAEASRSYQSACEKRYEHNDNYIGHSSHEKRDTHEDAAFHVGNKSVEYTNKS